MSYKLFAGQMPNTNQSVLSIINGGNFYNTVDIAGVDTGTRGAGWNADRHAAQIIFDSRRDYLRKWYEGKNIPITLAAKGRGASMTTYLIAQFNADLSDSIPMCMGKLSTDNSYAPIIPTYDNTRFSATVGHARFLTFAAKAQFISGTTFGVAVQAIEHYAGQSAPATTINLDVTVMGK